MFNTGRGDNADLCTRINKKMSMAITVMYIRGDQGELGWQRLLPLATGLLVWRLDTGRMRISCTVTKLLMIPAQWVVGHISSWSRSWSWRTMGWAVERGDEIEWGSGLASPIVQFLSASLQYLQPLREVKEAMEVRLLEEQVGHQKGGMQGCNWGITDSNLHDFVCHLF